jgi:hypothetical protein
MKGQIALTNNQQECNCESPAPSTRPFTGARSQHSHHQTLYDTSCNLSMHSARCCPFFLLFLRNIDDLWCMGLYASNCSVGTNCKKWGELVLKLVLNLLLPLQETEEEIDVKLHIRRIPGDLKWH